MTTLTARDTEGKYSWSQKVTIFDVDGFLIGETVTFDDGRIRTTTLVEGVRVGLTWSDPANGLDWVSRSYVYNELTGLLTSREVVMDSGRVITVAYSDGVKLSRSSSDLGNEFGWATRVQTYDSLGRIASSEVTLDDGRTVETDYVDGIKTQKVITDVADGFSWTTKVYDYEDATGILLNTTTTFDDGTSEIRGLSSGPLGQTVTRLDTGSAYHWSSKTIRYDAVGDIAERTVINDDGTQSVTQYNGGLRTQVAWTDGANAKSWNKKTLTYDAGGRLVNSDVILDDGRQTVQTFQDGVRTGRIMTDTLDASGWTSITQSFDSAGLIAASTVRADDGTTTTSTYSAGILQEKLRSDGEDVRNWDSIRTVYDGGALLYVHRTLDDGTQTFKDVRGQSVITGGTQASVTEDASVVLQATDTIGLVAGYRGATDFTAIARVVGDNGYGLFTLGTDGTWTYGATNNQTAVQALNAGDTLTDSFVATTTDGVSTEISVTINGAAEIPTNSDPVAEADFNTGTRLAKHGQALANGSLLSNDTDADGDVLSVVRMGSHALGTSAAVVAGVPQTVRGEYGSLVVQSDGSWEYQLDNLDPDTVAIPSDRVRLELFTYTVSDGKGGSAGSQLALSIDGSPPNLAPIAVDDTFALHHNSTSVLDLLANDTDANNTPEFETQPLTVDTINGSAATTGSVIATTNGSVIVGEGGVIRYIPNDGYSGPDSFNYVITDGLDQSNTATANLTIAAASPFSEGVVSGGYVIFAHVVADANGNGQWDSGEDNAFTNYFGRYILNNTPANADVRMIATGGKDISTGLTVDTPWMAPAGATSITALSTVTALLEDSGLAGNEAASLIYATFGLDPAIDFLNADPVQAVLSSDAGSAKLMATVVALQTAAMQISSAISATTTEEFADISNIVFAQIAGYISDETQTAGIFSELALRAITVGALVELGFTPSVANAIGDRTTHIIAHSASVIIGNLQTVKTGADFLTDVAQDAIVAQGAAATALAALEYDFASDGLTVDLIGVPVMTPAEFNSLIPDALDDVRNVVGGNSDPISAGQTHTINEDTVLSGMLRADDIDQQRLTFDVTTGPENGTVSIQDAPFREIAPFTYTPNVNFNGTDSFSFTVTDTEGGSTTETVNLTVNAINDNPIGEAVVVTMGLRTLITGTLTATDPEQTDLYFAMNTFPEFGTGSIALDGTYEYLPFQSFVGTDTFNYFVYDGVGGVSSQTISVTVTGVLDAFEVDEDTVFSGALSSEGFVSVPLTFAVATGPENGTVEILAATEDDDAPFTYTPHPDFNGTDSFSYTVTDAAGTTRTETVKFVVSSINDNPVGDPLSLAGDEGALLTGALSATDIEQTDLVFGLYSRPSNGTATVARDGTVEYTPNPNFSGTDSFLYSVIDRAGGVTTQTVNVTLNALPNAHDIDPIAGTTLYETQDTSNISGSILVSFVDDDLEDVGYSASVAYTGATGESAGLTLDNLARQRLIFQTGVTKDAGDDNGYLNLIFQANSAVFDYLADSETVTLNYEITIEDSAGGTDTRAFDVTIIGTDEGLSPGIAPISLSDVALSTNTQGFIIKGVSGNALTGASVSSAGDVNGDGLDDMIVGAPGNGAGASYVIFGKEGGEEVNLAALQQSTNTSGFVINGVSAGDRAGVSVSSAGDVNGDGLDDLIIGAEYDDPNGANSGASFVVFGKSDGAAVDLGQIEQSSNNLGFIIKGALATDFSGHSVSAAGDVNGDGLGDVIVGAYGVDPYSSNPNRDGTFGASYVVFGKDDGQEVKLSDIQKADNTGGFLINSASDGGSLADKSGYSVSSAGDVNGDGFDDLIVGAPSASGSTGKSFVVFGKSDGSAIELSALGAVGTAGFVISGGAGGDQAGESVSSAGDVNGDGLDDIIIGASGSDRNGMSSGTSYVVFGKTDQNAVTLGSVVGGDAGFAIIGESEFDRSGYSVSSAGDVNGDGLDDVIIGAFLDRQTELRSGASYVVFGKEDSAQVRLSEVKAGIGGFVLNGAAAYDYTGVSVSSAGDVNGDGFDDLIVGAPGDLPFHTDSTSKAGTSFVVFGGDFTGAATQIGSTAADNLVGSAAVDVLIGGTGDDTLTGNGGADVMRGGAGNDILAVQDFDFGKVDGGNGIDTLRLDGTGRSLDLSQIASPTLQDIERIDLNGGGNSLRLAQLEVLGMSDESNTLRVLGNTSDAVTLSGNAWAMTGQVTDSEGTFDVFSSGLATVEIAANIDVTGGRIAPIELSELRFSTDTRGFAINGYSTGISDYGLVGFSVSSAGDVNGDGLDDVIVGAPAAVSKTSYVVYGKSDGIAINLPSFVAGTDGFVINGASIGDFSGYSVSSAGDVNNDGLADFIVGANLADPNGADSGASFVVYGKTNGDAVDLADLQTGNEGFAINGVLAGDKSGFSVSSAGDVNGDGLDDLIVGAPNNGAGVSYVVFSNLDGETVELSDVQSGIGGFAINGIAAGDFLGRSVSSAGDVNGDGLDDLIVGAPFNDVAGLDSGASFVVFGKTDSTAVNLSSVKAGTGGFEITGASTDKVSGWSVSSAGDVNGDGLDDVVVGAYGTGPNGRLSGASYVVFSKTNNAKVDLSNIAAGHGGFVINGQSAEDESGWAVSSAGDVNGDGLDDLIIGAPSDATNAFKSGASYVVFGKADGTAVELGDLTASAGGFSIFGGARGGAAGSSVSAAGDVNGDGFDDLIIGAPSDATNGFYAGTSFVVYGGEYNGTATQVGTTSADVLIGTVNADVLIGGTGNDTLSANGGADVLRAGAGDDVIAISDLDFAKIDAGNGTDTLRLDGVNMLLDLPEIADPTLQSIERIDLNGDYNSLRLNRLEVLRLSAESNTLRVLGDISNDVTLADGPWLGAGEITDAEGTFNVFTNGLSRIEIGEALTRIGGPIDPGSIAVVELADIQQSANEGGFVINGVAAGDQSGFSVSGAGDVNGDGFEDLIIGATEYTQSGVTAGAGFVVFGKENGSSVDLADIAAGTGGFVITGVSENDDAGYSVSSAGDVNGDGLDDVIVSATGAAPNGFGSGASYVVFGKTDGAAVDLSAVQQTANNDGFVINGVSAEDFSGISVSAAGDVNGDGLDDVIVGAHTDDPNGTSSGASFVVFGKEDGTAVELSEIETGSGGFVINGVASGDKAGRWVSSAGDVNGDGLDDLLVGAPWDDPNGENSGASFVVFGKEDTAPVKLLDIEQGAGGGFVINGVSLNDRSATSVSAAGDVNGDGFDDLIIGAPYDDPNGGNSGASFVVFGKVDNVAVELADIEQANNSGGFVITGSAQGDVSGFSVSSAGDINGDGLDDLLIGALQDDPNGAESGATFVVYGKTDGTSVDLSQIEQPTNDRGFVINGVAAGDKSGASARSAGDVNGDGFDDLIIGAAFDDPNGANSGSSFVIFGGNFTGAATQVGTLGADDLVGSAAIDVLIAGTGDDQLTGNGGADVLRGGAGNDVIAIGDLDFAKIDGGTGTDTLRLDGSGLSLDLARISDTALQEIERIDLNGGGNALRLDTRDLLGLSGTSNTLRVLGSGSDAVSLVGMGWAPEAQVTDAEGTFNVLSDGLARIEIEVGIDVQGGPIAAIELSDIQLESDTRGFMISGTALGDMSGWSVSSAGDVNGDGFDDMIVGSPGGSKTHVVFGKATTTGVDLAEIQLSSNLGGFVIDGTSGAGFSVSSAGDVNADGFDDLIIGTGDDAVNAGDVSSLVVFGKADGAAISKVDVINSSNDFGFQIIGLAASHNSGPISIPVPGGGNIVTIGGTVNFNTNAGYSVSSAGDVNGDGLDDVIVGVPEDRTLDPNVNPFTAQGIYNPGTSFVVFGRTDGTRVLLDDISSTSAGFAIEGDIANEGSGYSVSAAGDVNGDGLDDVIVGEPFGEYADGRSYVVFGKTDSATIEMSEIRSGNGGFVINGGGGLMGFSVSSAGDVNGDGLDDLIIGSPHGSGSDFALRSGTSHVVFGKADGGAVDLADISKSDAVYSGDSGGFAINGLVRGDGILNLDKADFDWTGWSVSSAGDVNGDGLDDLIIGAPYADPNGDLSGASFVVFGKADGTAIDLSQVEDGVGGFVINGIGLEDYTGASVSSAGDVNGDGFDDLIVGAPDGLAIKEPLKFSFGVDPASEDEPSTGASFVVYGGNFTGAVTEVGTMVADNLSGTAAMDVIFAGVGDDTITGNGGSDRLSGGAGHDAFVFTDSGSMTTIIDFEDGLGGQDVLDVSAFGFTDRAEVVAQAGKSGAGGHDVLIQLDSDDSILLKNFDLADLDETDFVF